MSLSTRVLAALAAGVAIGLALSATGGTIATSAIGVTEPIGTLFVNAIRMTVIPLVVASLVVGVATSGDASVVARIGGRGVLVFLVLLVASGVVGVVVAPPFVAHMSLDPAGVAAVRAAAASTAGAVASTATKVESPAQWIVGLVPANAFRAATDGAMLPLIVFSLVLGLGLLRVEELGRRRAVALFQGVADSMLIVVQWLMVVAPIGVFALTVPLVARLGLGALGALATYVLLVAVACTVLMVLILYPAAAWIGGVPIARFARAVLPAQAVAFSSRSSIAALPALIDASRAKLGLPEQISSFFLPLSAMTFRAGATLGVTIGTELIARVYGITITPGQLATIVATSIVTSFSIPGIPGGLIIAMVPVLSAVGLPVEGIGIILGVDAIPDMFRTTANVTGHLAAATIVARLERRQPAVPSAASAS